MYFEWTCTLFLITGPEVRLVDGSTTNEGRVEIGFNGIWRTVCDDSWGPADADVVCRQLGYTGAGNQALGNAVFGPGSGSIFMDDVDCVGDEDSLDECPFGGWGVHNCAHNEDAGVICTLGRLCTHAGPILRQVWRGALLWYVKLHESYSHAVFLAGSHLFPTFATKTDFFSSFAVIIFETTLSCLLIPERSLC